MSYSVVLLDGKELHNLSAEQIRDLFFSRKINQESLFCSADNPRWQMLKRGFDLSKWVPVNTLPPPSIPVNHSQQQFGTNPFHTQPATPSYPQPTQSYQQPPPNYQPAQPPINNGNSTVTFNQFPPVSQSTQNHQAANGYSQNNQSETYYQAESNQTSYNFQNKASNYQPSQYNFPAGGTSQSSLNNPKPRRNGARQAALFLIVNAILYTILMVIGRVSDSVDSKAGAPSFRGMLLPLIIDMILAINLWSKDDVESARKWVLGRTYFGLVVFGIIFPVIGISSGEAIVAVFSFITTVLYFFSIGLTLHGKEEPSPSRLMIGAGTFAVYFLIMFGAIGLSVLGLFAPEIAQLQLKNREFDKYKIEGREFQDKTTGAKVSLPEGWSMISLGNPLVHTPEARMIAVDADGQSLTMLEVVPVPGTLDMKRQNPTAILDELSDNVVEAMREETEMSTGLAGPSKFSEITRMGISVGKHPAKLLVFEKQVDGQKMKGHMIITYDELTFYVLHSWCPESAYATKQNDFRHFEQNFVVPEKLNSAFTQTAENEKNKRSEKKF